MSRTFYFPHNKVGRHINTEEKIFYGGFSMKKLVSLLLAVCMCLSIGVMLTACGDEKEPHTHEISSEWEYDDYYHYHEASCGSTNHRADVALHEGDNCFCGYIKMLNLVLPIQAEMIRSVRLRLRKTVPLNLIKSRVQVSTFLLLRQQEAQPLSALT